MKKKNRIILLLVILNIWIFNMNAQNGSYGSNGYYGDSNYPGKAAGIEWENAQKKKATNEEEQIKKNYQDQINRENNTLEKLQKEQETAKKNKDSAEVIAFYEQKIESQKYKINKIVESYAARFNLNKEQPTVVGDPVLILSKKYYVNDEDTFFYYGKNKFSFQRYFTSSVVANGALGKSWSSSIDTRIIRGMEEESEKQLREAKDNKENHLTKYHYYNNKHQISIYNSVLNEKVAYGNEYEMMKNAGTNTLLFIDENNNKYVLALNLNTNVYESISKQISKEFFIKRINENSENGFEVIYQDGMKKKYNKYGLPEYFCDLYGREINFIYDEKNNLSKITHNGKTCLKFFWNKLNKLSEVDNEIYNQKIKYEYEGNQLTTIVDYANNKYGFKYDADGDIIQLIKPDESKITIEYCKKQNSKTLEMTKNVISTYSENYYQEKFDTNENEKILNYTDADGNTTEYTIENDSQIIKEIYPNGTFLTRKFDENENVIEVNNKYGTVKNEYDKNNNLIFKSFEDGSNEVFTYNNKNKILSYKNRDNILSNYIYDSYGNVVEVLRDGKKIISISYNEWGGVSKQSGIYGNNEYTYNENYQLVSDKENNYEYNDNAQLSKVINRQGFEWTYEYGDLNKTIIQTDPFGLITKMKRNSRGDITRFVQIDSKTKETYLTIYNYDKSHNLTSVEEGKGSSEEEAESYKEKIISYVYSKTGKLISQIKWNLGAAFVNDAPGVLTEYAYNQAGKLCSEIHCFVDEAENKFGTEYKQLYLYSYPKGEQEITVVDGNNQKTKHYYSKNGTLLKSIDAENKTIYRTCSCSEKILSEKNIFGGVVNYNYDNAIEKISSISDDKENIEYFKYNDDGQISYKKEVDGVETFYSYKEDNGIYEVESEATRGYAKQKYDSLGRLIENIIGNSKNDILFTQNYTFADDNRSFLFSNGNQKISFELDCFQNITYSSTNNKHLKFNKKGNLIREQETINGKSSTEDYLYNAENLISQITQSDGTVIDFYYNPCNQLIKKSDNLGVIWQGEYDKAGNLISEKGRILPKKEYIYDKAGVLIETKEADITIKNNKYSNNMKNLEVVDANGNSIFYEYDNYGNLLSKTDRLGNVMKTETDYSKNETKITDYNGNVSNLWNNRKNGIQEISYNNGSKDIYEYDFAGGLTNIENENQTEKIKFNSMHKILSTSINENIVKYNYDELGKKKSIATENLYNNFSFDNSGKIINASCNGYDMKFVYNEDGNEILSIDKGGSVIETEYDIIDRPVLITQKNGDNKMIYAEGTVYDDEGKICCTTDLEGNLTTYEYDEHGRISCVNYPYIENYKLVAEKEFTECGKKYSSNINLLTLEIPSEYLNELQSIWHKIKLSNPKCYTQKVWTENYIYDKCGNRICKTNPIGTLEYEYDAENRLTKILGSTPVIFEYDKNGNLIKKNSVYELQTLIYTKNDRVKESVLGDKNSDETLVTNYSYDALGRKISETSNGIQKEYYYDGLSFENLFTTSKIYTKSLSNSTESNSIRYRDIDNTINGSNAKIICRQKNIVNVNGSLRFQVSENDSLSFCNDIRGSVRSVVNGSGGKVATVRYTSDGEPFINTSSDDTSLTWSSPTSSSLSFDNYFCGKEYNSLTKQYNFGFRDYSASLGRFTTVDPICDGENWYAYCNGDAVNFVDPLGLKNLAPKILKNMQCYGKIILGESRIEWLHGIKVNEITYIDNAGCLLNFMSGVINTLYDEYCTPVDLNNVKSNFIKHTDCLSKTKILYNYQLNYDYWTTEKQGNLSTIINDYNNSERSYVLNAKITYLHHENGKIKKGTHWIGIKGGTVTINGKEYEEVVATSQRDCVGESRPDFIEKDGKTYVDVGGIIETRAYWVKADGEKEVFKCTK